MLTLSASIMELPNDEQKPGVPTRNNGSYGGLCLTGIFILQQTSSVVVHALFVTIANADYYYTNAFSV